MYKRHSIGFFARSLCLTLALGAFAAISGQTAHAQAVKVTTPAQLSGGSTTGPYPGANFSTFTGPFNLTAGSTTVTFTDTGGTGQFSRFNADGSVDFPTGTPLIQTANAGGVNGGTPQAPLMLSFSSGVTGFGLGVQDYQFDQETFTVEAFSGATSLGVFTYAPVNNDPTAGAPAAGRSVFVGALSNGGSLITRATISSTSSVAGGSNNFFAGPLTVTAAAVNPAPEASTIVSFGTGIFFVAGLALIKRKRGADQTV